MVAVEDFLRAVNELASVAQNVIDESRRILIEGRALDGSLASSIIRIIDAANDIGIDAPVMFCSEDPVTRDDLIDSAFFGCDWRIVLAKTPLAKRLQARDDEDTLVFFSVEGFERWLERVDPFAYPSGSDPDFCCPLTIRVYGLRNGVAGPSLWVLPIDSAAPDVRHATMPTSVDVQGLIHIRTTEGSLRICPLGFALAWGVKEYMATNALLRISALVLSVCLVQELICVDGRYEVTLRGAKRITLPLSTPRESVTPATLDILNNAVSWVYEERAETRLKLIMDRLSIESQPGDTFLSSVAANLDAALQQARDSYAFVILERKDAYYKELRELMKDMKVQADLYAAKVRDLVGSLTRDVLGVLVLVGFSFIGKFDQKNLMAMLGSNELALLAKVLAGYFVLSCALQLFSHGRDAKLSYVESERWLEFLQNYTSRKEKRERFLGLLKKRRTTLYVAMWISGVFYVGLFFITWNLPHVIRWLLM